MTSHEIRAKFLDFFASKGHKIVPSAPVVRKNDPTLMFTNSGMAPFKDCFLGNLTPPAARVADSQKCLRVSGKHNDLEDVGLDGTHHTLFEMLGNWSFGDYFKEEAIAWSWELLTEVYGMEKDRLYATVFEGDAGENLEEHTAAYKIWLKYLPKEQILFGNKKDNFWEMGEQGPCGPCSEIHYDVRSAAERAKGDGASLVNVDDSGVVEIWNNVFMKYNRKADGSLEDLPARHVDTGMGFERLCMVLQNKTVTYETDVFRPYITYIEGVSGKKYTGSFDRNAKTDIAMRVCADHIRAVAFTIADGQLPASNGAGYVIRRILRRAVRYYFSFLDIKEPFLCTMIPILADDFKDVFPELYAQKDFVEKVILEEERSFLRTLESGLKLFDALEIKNNEIAGKQAFQLLDTFGFPIDLTELIAAEKGFKVDMDGFKIALQEQKDRSKIDAAKQVGDWQYPQGINPETAQQVKFIGYERTEWHQSNVLKYRTVENKNGLQYQVVLDITPFYGESGGQVGDSGVLLDAVLDIANMGHIGSVRVLDTKKENDLTIHIIDRLPDWIDKPFTVLPRIDKKRRKAISANHTAAHLLHAAIHEVIGEHAVQKGQSVDEHRLRFDISHFQACTKDELVQIERLVNQKIRENIALDEQEMDIEDARETGAMMLFGEKYGETVRVITFDEKFSIELCGGTHVKTTSQLGYFKITSESALAAGVRRIEAVTNDGTAQFVEAKLQRLDEGMAALKNPKDFTKAITDLQDKLKAAEKKIEEMGIAAANAMQNSLKNEFFVQNGINILIKQVDITDAKALKNLMGNLERETGNAVLIFGTINNEKPQLTIQISENITKTNGLHAGNLVREAAKLMNGGGGGQAMFATAGGTDAGKLAEAMDFVKNKI